MDLCCNFSLGKLTDGDVLLNGNVQVNDWADPNVAWKDAGWAGFDGNRLKITLVKFMTSLR